jgi:hypothetical protein
VPIVAKCLSSAVAENSFVDMGFYIDLKFWYYLG